MNLYRIQFTNGTLSSIYKSIDKVEFYLQNTKTMRYYTNKIPLVIWKINL